MTQATIDLVAWFLVPFAFMLVIEWVVRFFRRD